MLRGSTVCAEVDWGGCGSSEMVSDPGREEGVSVMVVVVILEAFHPFERSFMLEGVRFISVVGCRQRGEVRVSL